MKQLILASLLAFAFACAKGSNAPACSANQTNRCSCGGSTEGLQVCLSSGQAFGACSCSDACANGADCVLVPNVIGADMDQTGAAIADAGLALPDPVTLDGGFTVVQQINDPPVEVLAQDPPAGTLAKRGAQVNLTVTIPPDQESLGLPNSHFLVGALNQDTDISAEDYYDAIDPGPFPKRATLQDWKDANGFGSNRPADLEAQATYVSHADLGFGRHMHVRKEGKRVAFYVDNFLTADDAVKGSNFFATVTMEWSQGPNGSGNDPYFTQFYVYDKKGNRITDPKLDDHGPKNNPAVCLACHGGNTDLNYQANGGNIGAHFVPFDLDALSYSKLPGATRADQEAAFKVLNEAVYSTWDRDDPDFAPDGPPVIQMIDNWYGGPGHPSPIFISGTVLPGWDVPAGRDLFLKVFGRNCITCHAQREPFRNFARFANFDAQKALITTRVFEQGIMPLSEKGSRNFWLSYPNEARALADYLNVAFKSPGKPVAHIVVTHAGPQLTAGTLVTLSGQTSQYARTYTWTQTSGPAVQLIPATADNSVMTFVAPASGVTFQLVVSLFDTVSPPDNAAVAVLSAPIAPSAVTATAGLNGASVTWTQANDGGSPVLHSTVIASPGNITVQVPGSGTTANVPGLTAGTTYTFTVVATNEIDDSTASTPSNAVTVFTTPGSPIGVQAVRGNTQVALSWTAPANTGGVPLVAYQITATPAIATVRVSASTLSTLIGGLANGTSYVFNVAADNGALSPPAASPAVTPDVAPNSPTNVIATQTGSTSATVSWSAPVPNGGTGVTGYQVTAVNAADGTGPSIVVPATPLVANVGGLVANATYTFFVEAQNGFGLGATSPSSNAVFMATTVGAPSQPNNVAAAFDGSVAPGEAAIVSWTAPNNQGNSPISNYEISANPAPGGVTPSPVFVGTSLSGRMTGLTGGVNYTFTVAAVNTQGTGPGTASNAVAIHGRPQPPSISNVVPAAPGIVNGSGSLTASWTGPSNTGGDGLTGYTVSFGATNVGAGPGAVSLNSGALPIRCVTYAVHVVANNIWGSSAASGTINRANAVTPAQVVGQSAASPSPARMNVSWSAVAETGCPVTYTVSSTPAGLGFSTTGTSGTNLLAQSCGYSAGTQHCGRAWFFNVSASNAVGTGATSGATGTVRPLVSYSLDGVDSIWAGSSCTSCHTPGGPGAPFFLDQGTTTNYNTLVNTGGVAVNGNPGGSQIVLCPEGSNSCVCADMRGVTRLGSGSAEIAAISAWINDSRQQ